MITGKIKNSKQSLNENMIIHDNYDGAEHRKIQQRKNSIVSFSSRLIS